MTTISNRWRHRGRKASGEPDGHRNARRRHCFVFATSSCSARTARAPKGTRPGDRRAEIKGWLDLHPEYRRWVSIGLTKLEYLQLCAAFQLRSTKQRADP